MTRSTRTVQMGGTDSVRLWNPRRFVVAACMTLCVLAASCNGVSGFVTLRDPWNATDALRLFEASTVAGEALQAQRAMHWIQRNFVSVLQAPELTTLLPECLMSILNQPILVPEIEVFRAVRRVIASYSSCRNSTTSARHQIPRSVLLSTVRFFAIDPSMFRSEVVPSGIVPNNVILQVLLKSQSLSGRVPEEYQRPAPRQYAYYAGHLVNVMIPKNGPTILQPGTAFTLSAACKGRNPLLTGSNKSSSDCYLESPTSQYVTVQLPNRYFIRVVELYGVPAADRHCTGVRVETTADGRHFELAAVLNNFSDVEFFLLPTAREVSAIRYKVDGECKNPSGTRLNSIRVTALRAFYLN